jgi:hypothetical protein
MRCRRLLQVKYSPNFISDEESISRSRICGTPKRAISEQVQHHNYREVNDHLLIAD